MGGIQDRIPPILLLTSAELTAMNVEDKKIIKVFTKQGHQFDILTRAPREEIVKQLETPLNEFAEIHALDGANNHVVARIDRTDISAYFIMNAGKVLTPR